MIAKNNVLRFRLILGLLGIVCILAIFIPNISRHYRNAEALSNAISNNLANNNEKPAAINRQLLESQNNAIRSSILSATGLIVLALTTIANGFLSAYYQNKNQQEKQKVQTE